MEPELLGEVLAIVAPLIWITLGIVLAQIPPFCVLWQLPLSLSPSALQPQQQLQPLSSCSSPAGRRQGRQRRLRSVVLRTHGHRRPQTAISSPQEQPATPPLQRSTSAPAPPRPPLPSLLPAQKPSSPSSVLLSVATFEYPHPFEHVVRCHYLKHAPSAPFQFADYPALHSIVEHDESTMHIPLQQQQLLLGRRRRIFRLRNIVRERVPSVFASRFESDFAEIEELSQRTARAVQEGSNDYDGGNASGSDNHQFEVASQNTTFSNLGVLREYSRYVPHPGVNGHTLLEQWAEIEASASMPWLLRRAMDKAMVPTVRAGYADTQLENHEFLLRRLREIPAESASGSS